MYLVFKVKNDNYQNNTHLMKAITAANNFNPDSVCGQLGCIFLSFVDIVSKLDP